MQLMLKHNKGLLSYFLLLLIIIPIVDSSLLVKGEIKGMVVLREHLFFKTEFDSNLGIVTRLTNAEFHVFLENAEPDVSHNLTVIFESRSVPMVISDYEYELAEISKRVYSVSVRIPGSEGHFYVIPDFFNWTIRPPVVLTLLPPSLTAVEYIPGGWCNLMFSINTSILFHNATIDVRTGHDFYDAIYKPSFEAVNRTYYCMVPEKEHPSQGYVTFCGATRDSSHIIPVDVYLDGREVETDKIAHYYLSQRFDLVPRIPIPHYDNESFIYLLNFSSVSEFTVRLDTGNREQICYLDLESPIDDFDATEVTAFDQSYYQIRVKLQKPGRCYLGLGVLSKKWTKEEAYEDWNAIPPSVKSKYLSPTGSSDWQYIDNENPVVKLWASEFKLSEMGIWDRCYALFIKLNGSLKYNETFADSLPHSQETASATLLRGGGVCRHFARTYAAILLDMDVPVRTVIGTAFIGPDTYKKNHEWNEVYIPGLGWVTVDIAWNATFARLPPDHIQYTVWSYEGESFNISQLSNPILDDSSILVINRLEEIYVQRLEEVKGLLGAGIFADKLERVPVLLEMARVEAIHGSIHSALLSLAEAQILVNHVRTQIYSIYGYILFAFIIMSAIIAYSPCFRKKSKKC